MAAMAVMAVRAPAPGCALAAAAVAAAAVAAVVVAPACAPSEPRCRVFVASSMHDVVGRIANDLGVPVELQPAASSTLARQIQQGAAADVVISAHASWLDLLEADGLLRGGSRRVLVHNRIVLAAPVQEPARDRPRALDVRRGFDLGGAFTGRLAVGDPSHVPAGQYAKQALEQLGVWDAVRDRLAPTVDARAALALVERGEVELGIVYASDAAQSDRVAVVGRFPDDVGPAVVYEIAELAAAPHPELARRLVAALCGPGAQEQLTAAGFAPVLR